MISLYRWVVYYDCVELYLFYFVVKCDNVIYVVIILCYVEFYIVLKYFLICVWVYFDCIYSWLYVVFYMINDFVILIF